MFDLLLVLVVLALIVTLAAAAVASLRGRRDRAVRLLRRCLVGLTIYFGLLVAVSLLSPQRILEYGETRCFDDWCITIEGVTRATELGPSDRIARADGIYWVTTVHLSNRGRGRDQRAGSVALHLVDGAGRRFDLSPRGLDAYQAQHGPVPPLTSVISVGQSVRTVQVFDLPRDAERVSLTVEHPVGLSPGLFVIGDEASLFHKPTIVPLK